MKKVLFGLGALAIALAVIPMFAAFEAHVINVTAKIENALSVPTEHIIFGTVFPQERLEKPLGISLSQSFRDENRVDDVDYIIRQKPKCGVTTLDGQKLVEGSTKTGHVVVGDNPATPSVVEEYWIDCGDAPVQFDPTTHMYGVLPNLCPYISKHPDERPKNDGKLNSFHPPFQIINGKVVWTDTGGHLAKGQQDLEDIWTIDLVVPCFGGHCAQDWDDFVKRASEDDKINPDDYVQPEENEHKIFGCDLWVEVRGISLPGIGCLGKADVMLTLDRSGSIGSTELATMKDAAKAFVGALGMGADATHAGLVSFSSSATLDVHLTDASSTVATAIDALVASGATNLEDALLDATAELANPGDGHDRADGGSPDFIVLITDGAPTASNGPGSDEDDAEDAADAAKAAGITIYVVGVGTTVDTANYLKTSIATSEAHYFDAADFEALKGVLEGLTTCPD